MIWEGIAKVYYQAPLQWLDDFQWQSWLYRLGRGEIPYKDFFVLYGPLLPYVFLLPFKILGKTFFAWNVIRYLFLPVFCYITAILISKKVFKTEIFIIIFLLIASTYDAWGFFFLQPWMFRIWLGIFSLVIVFSKLKQRYFLIGAWLAVLFFSSLDQAAYVFITLSFLTLLVFVASYFSKKNISFKLQPAYSFVLGFALFFSVPFLFLLLTGGLENYLRFSFSVLPNTEITSFGLIFPQFPIHRLKAGLFSFIISKEIRYYLPLFVYISYIAFSVREFFLQKKINWILIFLTIYGIFSFRTALGRSDFGHLMSVSVPAVYLILAYTEKSLQSVLHIIADRKKNIINILKATTLLFFITGVFLFFYLTRSSIESGFWGVFNPNRITNDRKVFADTYNPILKVNIGQEQSKSLTEAINFINNIPDKQFYVHGNLTGLHYLTGFRNLYYYDPDNWTSETEQRKILERLEKEKKQYVITLINEDFFRGSLLDDYFNEYYSFYKQFGDLVIWKRNEKTFNNNFSGILVASITYGWQNTGIPLMFEFSVKEPVEISNVKIALKLSYFPLLSNLAKTQAKLGVEDEVNITEWFVSDTIFVPKYSLEGQLNFHLYKKVSTKKLILKFSSPGGLNPAPVNIDIRKTWLYR